MKSTNTSYLNLDRIRNLEDQILGRSIVKALESSRQIALRGRRIKSCTIKRKSFIVGD